MTAFWWPALKIDWVLQPLLFCTLLIAGLGLCLVLFLTLKREMAALVRQHRDDRERLLALESGLDQARQSVASFVADLHDVQSQTGMLVEPAPARSGLNLSKRTQVLRMHRAGQDSAGIAAALSLPRAEVDLLLKVHRMVVQQL